MLRPTNQNREAHAKIDAQIAEYLASGDVIQTVDHTFNARFEEQKHGLQRRYIHRNPRKR